MTQHRKMYKFLTQLTQTKEEREIRGETLKT